VQITTLKYLLFTDQSPYNLHIFPFVIGLL